MERSIKDKVAVITGGARGIGYEIAKHFLMNEAKTVIILDVLEAEGSHAAQELNNTFGANRAAFIKCDVTQDLDRVTEQIFSEHTVDILVNNAAISDLTSVRKIFDVNAVGAIECAMKFWEHMRKDKGGYGGTIINNISIYGYRANASFVYYTSTKHAMVGFTKSLGHTYNYENFGVRVIGMCPGFTETVILSIAKLWPCHQEYSKEFSKTIVFQPVEIVAKAAVDIFKVAESGTLWEIEDSKPIRQVSIDQPETP